MNRKIHRGRSVAEDVQPSSPDQGRYLRQGRSGGQPFAETSGEAGQQHSVYVGWLSFWSVRLAEREPDLEGLELFHIVSLAGRRKQRSTLFPG